MNEPNRIADLIHKYLDRDASPAEIAELQQQICEDAQAAEMFAEKSRLESWIAQSLQEEKNIVVETQRWTTLLATLSSFAPRKNARSPSERRRRFATAFCVLAASVLVLATFHFWPRTQSTVVENLPSYQVVTGEVVVNGQPTNSPSEGDLVQVVGTQPARLNLSDGSRAELKPATQMVFLGQVAKETQVLELVEGGGTFHVDPGQETLQVETQVGRVTATGTQFGVQLLPRRNPEEPTFAGTTIAGLAVLVYSGIVQVDIEGQNYVFSGPGEQVFRADAKVIFRRRETVSRIETVDMKLVVLDQGRLRKKIRVPVNSILKITLDGRPGLVSDLVAGMTAYIQRPVSGEEIVGLRIEGATVMGVLKAVDQKAGAITLTIPKGAAGTQEQVLPLHPEVKVSLKGQQASLGALVTGTSVVVKLTAGGQRALLISTPDSRREKQ